jgi:hypothetical protein
VQIQREILNHGGVYPGLPPDLGRNGGNWQLDKKEQARLNKVADLNSTGPTSAGTGPSGADDQAVEDFSSLIEKTLTLAIGNNKPPLVPSLTRLTRPPSKLSAWLQSRTLPSTTASSKNIRRCIAGTTLIHVSHHTSRRDVSEVDL